MKYNIYYHNDLDGTASAAVMRYFFNKRGDSLISATPVDYTPDFATAWPDYPFQDPFVVVDFNFHPRASWWFDHHQAPFAKSGWQENFKETPQHVWDKDSPSCCGLIIRHLEKSFKEELPERLKELGREVDIIDGARYRNVEDAFDVSKPIRQIALAFFKGKDNLEYQTKLIELLSEQGPEEVARMEFVHERFKLAKERRDISLEYQRENMRLDGNTAFINFSKSDMARVNMAPYFIYPQAVYSIMIMKNVGSNSFHLGVAVNPWKKDKNKVNIGKLLKTNFGGGGHVTVGGADFGSYKEAAQAAEDVAKLLKNNG